MLQTNIQAIILAASTSSTLNTANWLTEKICGQPIIIFITKLFETLKINTTIIVDYQNKPIKELIATYHPEKKINISIQEQQDGIAHALSSTRLDWQQEHILIIDGNIPLVTSEIITSLYSKHIASNATISFINTDSINHSTTYSASKIVDKNRYNSGSINANIYLVKKSFLERHIESIALNDVSKEFSIADLIHIASQEQEPIATIHAPFDNVCSINNQYELLTAEQVLRSQLIKYWIDNGVRFSVTHNIYIDVNVTIGKGTYIGCGAHLLSDTRIGTDCKIHDNAILEHVSLGNNSTIYPFSIVKNSVIGDNTEIGPFAHIRSNSIIANNSVIGNFVEIKNSTIGNTTKVKHHSYIGDTTVGNHVNIGAGTITCNFDGKKKHSITINDHAFIGSNNTLVAPLTIQEKAFTAAGSTITEDVPPRTLAIARMRQINKVEYMTTKKQNDILNRTPSENETFFGATVITNDIGFENDRQ